MVWKIQVIKLICILLQFIIQIQSTFKYNLEFSKDKKNKTYYFTLIDLQDDKKIEQIFQPPMTIIPFNNKNQNIDLNNIDMIVQIQHYETDKMELVDLTSIKRCEPDSQQKKQQYCNCDIIQQSNSVLPNLADNEQMFQYQTAKSYAFFQSDNSTLYVLLILYDGYHDRKIFLNYDFNLYYIDRIDQNVKFQQYESNDLECDLLAQHLGLMIPKLDEEDENFEKEENIRKKKLEIHRRECAKPVNKFQNFDIKKQGFFSTIIFNRLNEPLKQQVHFEAENKKIKYKKDEALNTIVYDLNASKLNQFSAIFFISPRVSYYKYNLYKYILDGSNVIAISENIPINKQSISTTTQQKYHFILYIGIKPDEQSNTNEITFLFYDLYQESYKSQSVFKIQSIEDSKLVQIMVDIKNESHNINFDNSPEARGKRQQFFIQSQYDMPKFVKLYFSHFKYKKIKLFGDVTKVNIYQLNFHFFELSQKLQSQEQYQGVLAYLNCKEVLQDNTFDYYQIQECNKYQQAQYKKILIANINGIVCSVNLNHFDNRLYEMYFINKIFQKNKYNAQIKEVIKVDRRYSDFQTFNFQFYQLPHQDFKCSLQVIENKIFVKFSNDLQQNAIKLSYLNNQLIVRLKNYQQTIAFETYFSTLSDCIQNNEIKLYISGVNLTNKFIKQNHYVLSSTVVFIPLIVADPRFNFINSEQFHKQGQLKSILKDYELSIHYNNDPLSVYQSINKSQILILLENRIYDQDLSEITPAHYIILDIDQENNNMILRSNNRTIVIHIGQHFQLIEKQSFKKLNLHIYILDQQNQSDGKFQQINIELDLITKVSNKFMMFNFKPQDFENILHIFEYEELYFFEALQHKYNFHKHDRMVEFSEFDSESQSFSEMEEITGDIFSFKLTTNNAIQNSALLHYEIQIDSSKFIFNKNVLNNLSTIRNDKFKMNSYFNFYDMMLDKEMETHPNIYCASSLIDIQIECPLNKVSFEQIELNKNEDQLVAHDPFFDDKTGFVFTLIAPRGQLFVMDFIYKKPSNNVIQNCIALIFTETSLYISTGSSSLSLKALYENGETDFNAVKAKIYRTLVDGTKQNQNLLSFLEEMKKGAQFNINVNIFNSGDRGETSRFGKLQKTFKSKFTSHKQIGIQQNNGDSTDGINFLKSIKLTQQELERIQQLRNQRSEYNLQEEIVIKVIPLVFNLVTQNPDIKQRPNNLLKLKQDKSTIQQQSLQQVMNVDSFDKKFIYTDYLSESFVSKYQQDAERRRQENMQNIKDHLKRLNQVMTNDVKAQIDDLIDQQKKYDSHYYSEFGG